MMAREWPRNKPDEPESPTPQRKRRSRKTRKQQETPGPEEQFANGLIQQFRTRMYARAKEVEKGHDLAADVLEELDAYEQELKERGFWNRPEVQNAVTYYETKRAQSANQPPPNIPFESPVARSATPPDNNYVGQPGAPTTPEAPATSIASADQTPEPAAAPEEPSTPPSTDVPPVAPEQPPVPEATTGEQSGEIPAEPPPMPPTAPEQPPPAPEATTSASPAAPEQPGEPAITPPAPEASVAVESAPEPQPQLTPEQERRLFEEAERLAKAAGLKGEEGVWKAYQHILRFFSDTALNRVINENLADRTPRPAGEAPAASTGAPGGETTSVPSRHPGMSRAEQEAAFEEFAQRKARTAQQTQELRRTRPFAAPASPEQIHPWDEDDARILKRYADLELTLADSTRKGVRPSPEEERELAFYRHLVDETKLREYAEAKPILADLEARLAALPPQPPETVPVLDESTLAEHPATDGVRAEYPVTAPGPIGVPVLDEGAIAEHPATDGLEAEYPKARAPEAPPEPPAVTPTPEVVQTRDQRLNGVRRRMDRIHAWFSAAASRVWPFGRRAEAPPEPSSEPPSEAELRAMDVSAFRTAEEGPQPEGRKKSIIQKELAWHAGRVAANSLGSIFGVKFAWDAYAYLKERGSLNREREQVQLALIEMSRALREVRKEKIIGQEQTQTRHAAAQALWGFRKRIKEDAAYLPAAERIELRKGLRRIEGISRGLNADFTVSELDRVGKLTRLYLVGKTSGYQVVKQGLNSLLFWGSLAVPGAMALRGVVYPGMAALERAAKAGRWHEQQQFFDYGSHSRPFWTKQLEKFGAQAKDLFVTSARETHDDLRGKRGALGRISAIGTLATALGIGGTAIRSFADHAPSETITQLLDAFEARGMRGVAQTTGDNFLKNASDLSERLHLPRFGRAGEPFAASDLNETMPVPEPAGPAAIRLSPEAMEHIRQGTVGELTGQQQETIRDAAQALGAARDATEPGALAEALTETPAATIEQGGNVWQTARTLVAEGKISGEDFARAWEHSVKDLPDLVHRGDIVKFIPGAGDAPPRFEVIAESGLATGTARELADVYESLGKEVPTWLQQKIEAAPSLDQRISLIPNTAPEEFREALGGVTAVFNAKDLATQEQALGNLQELREHLEYQWRAAHGDEARLADIAEDMAKLDATRQQFVGSIEFLKQSRAFDELLRSVEVPSAQQPLLEKLTVTELLERKDTNALRGLKPLAELVERYIKLTPRYEHPREQIVATFLKKFIVGGKIIEPPTAV